MYNIHEKAESIRADGLKEIMLPLGILLVAARDPRTKKVNCRPCTRKDLPTEIKGCFRTLRSDWLGFGLLDPSIRAVLTISDESDHLGFSRDQDLSVRFLDDLWIVLHHIFEHHVALRTGFKRSCIDFINAWIYIQMLRNPPKGHC